MMYEVAHKELFAQELRMSEFKCYKNASLFEKELFLKIKAGYVIGEYEKDNTHFYNDEKEMMERNMNDLLEALLGEKVRKKRSWLKRLCKWMETKFRYLFRI